MAFLRSWLFAAGELGWGILKRFYLWQNSPRASLMRFDSDISYEPYDIGPSRSSACAVPSLRLADSAAGDTRDLEGSAAGSLGGRDQHAQGVSAIR